MAQSGQASAMAAVTAARELPATAPTLWSRFPRVLGLAWPVLVENFLQTMVGTVDALMVSFLGTVALAGVGATMPLFFLIQAAITAVALGGTVLVAHAVGAKDPSLGSRAAKQALYLGLIVSAALTVAGVPLARPILALLGPEEGVLAIGAQYFSITMVGAVGLVMMLVFGGLLRGAGDTRTPMLAGMAMNVINVSLAYLLIFGHGGFPQLGAAGSAWAANVARLAGAIALAAVLWRGRAGVSLKGRSGWRPDPVVSRRILRIGVPTMIEHALLSSSILVFTGMVISLGTNVFAAQRITFQVLTMAWLPGFAFAIAATTLVGQSIGARDPDEAIRVTWVAIISVFVFMLGLSAVFLFLGSAVVSLFTTDPEILSLGGAAMRLLSFSLPIFGIAMVFQGALRGAGDTQFPMYTTGLLSWLFRLPVAWFLGIHLGYGLLGMYWVFIGENLLRGLASYLRFRGGGWKRRQIWSLPEAHLNA